MGVKLFRDPVYDYIQIDEQYSWLVDLINTPEVQRLRYISQLGLCNFTYPGATHSRFSHSLGVLHLMQLCVNHLEREYQKSFKRLEKEALLAAALLHDIGHSPLSHVTEGFFGDHEDRTVDIILSTNSDINEVLSRRSKSLPTKTVALIAKRPINGTKVHLWQKALISSQLDMDRLDYLRRDSLCSGAEYGNFDWFRIIQTMQLREKTIAESRQKGLYITWPNKSKYALEEYIFARFYMYQSVYFHHTTRGFESLLRKLLLRAQDLVRKKSKLVAEFLKPIKNSLQRKPKLSGFQKLTDNVILCQIDMWRQSKDIILRDLSERLINRTGLAWAKASGVPFEIGDKLEAIRAYLNRNKLDPRYYFIEDKTRASLYKPYSAASSLEEQSSVTSILLYDPDWRGPETGFREITQVPGLGRLKAITEDQGALLRYYFPKEHQTQIRKILGA